MKKVILFVLLATCLMFAQTLITKVYYLQFQQEPTPARPPSRSGYLYLGTDGKLHCLNSDGSSCMP